MGNYNKIIITFCYWFIIFKIYEIMMSPNSFLLLKQYSLPFLVGGLGGILYNILFEDN